MKYLIDTHIFLWTQEDSPRLKPTIRNLVRDTQNIVYISIVSLWEIAIKVSLKKLRLKTQLNTILNSLEFEVLPIKFNHLLGLLKLPHLHKDPFDRLLVAQAKAEKFKLLSSDPKIPAYFP